MAVTLDLSTDHHCYDNFEEIVYQSFRRLGEPAADEDLYAKAKRGPLTTKELFPSAGAYTASDVAWSFWENENLAGFRPKPGDQIIDPDQEAYTVLEATRKKFRNTHRLITRNLAIAFNLRDSITIEQAQIVEQTTIAARTRSWKPLFTNLRCRVQPQDETMKDERSVMGGSVRYTVLLSRQLRWDNVGEVRIKWETADGVLYLDPEKYHMAEQIGELPRIEASRKV